MTTPTRCDPPTCPSCLGAHRRGAPHYPPIHEPRSEAPPTLAIATSHAATLAITSALALTSGNIRRAARLLQLSPSALHRRIAASAELSRFAATFTRSERQPARQR